MWGSPARKPREQINPGGAQQRLALGFDRHHAAGLYGRQEVGADIGQESWW